MYKKLLYLHFIYIRRLKNMMAADGTVVFPVETKYICIREDMSDVM